MEWEATDSTTVSSSACSATSENGPYKATEMWQELVQGFRRGMPRQRRRVGRRLHEECFTGSEAVEWMHDYLQTSGQFGAVSRQQAVKLLQKFLQSDVIKEVRGKQLHFSEDSGCRYSFVTEPGPFNFLEESLTSPLGKRERGGKKKKKKEAEEESEGTCFVNTHALAGAEERSEDERKEGRRKSARLSLMDVNSRATAKPSAPRVAEIWKELTLARLLRLIEMPTLDGVLSHDAVDGKQIEQNVVGIVPRLFRHSHGHSHSHPSRPLAQASQEATDDFPSWVTTMLKCLARWPEGCPADVATGQPQTIGLEAEVLRSLEQYLFGLPEPLISPKLYGLHMAVYSLLREGKPSAADALQLCSLLLPQTNRTRVHRVLRTIEKASTNPRLHLSSTHSNRDVMVSTLSLAVLRPNHSLDCTEVEQTGIRNLIWFMSQHYGHIFKVPDDLRQQVHKRIRAITLGKELPDMSEAKTFCQRVTHDEYEAQMKSVSQQSIAALLDKIATDENMPDKEKKQKLKLFHQQYPDIYAKKFGTQSQPSHSKSWQFSSLRRRSKPILR